MPVKINDSLLWKPYPIECVNLIVKINQGSLCYSKFILWYLMYHNG